MKAKAKKTRRITGPCLKTLTLTMHVGMGRGLQGHVCAEPEVIQCRLDRGHKGQHLTVIGDFRAEVIKAASW